MSAGRLVLLLLLLEASTAFAQASHHEIRRLFIALDAVPYATVERLADPARGEAALFRGLRGPVPLVSTFPSTTSIAFPGILEPLGLERSLGYEAKFFDRDANRIRGGGLISYGRIKFPWRRFWDWKLRGTCAKIFSGAHPVQVSQRSIRRALDAFLASDKVDYFFYSTTTDLVSHMKSPDGLEPVLRTLDEALADARRRSGRPFEVVLFSDHGNAGGEKLVNVRKHVYRALKAAGFERQRKLKTDRSAVFVPFGLVSSFVVFTAEGREADVARTIGKVDGIEVCAAPADGGWIVAGNGGTADVRRRGDDWSYERVQGDPLKLAATGLADGAFHSDDAFFEATHSHVYPDVLYRIARGFDLVENAASVICTTAPGHMFGPWTTDWASRLTVGRLRWTHGALGQDASFGFLMSDAEGWEPPNRPVRFNRALVPFLRESP